MISLLLVTVMTMSNPADVELEGTVSVVRGPGVPSVVFETKDEPKAIRLSGPVADELRKLQSAKVRLRGQRDDGALVVQEYDLLSVYGKTPIVGQITEISGKIALVDGDGPAILLNLAPRSYKRFLEARGQRSWVTGKLLLSGEFKVGRYGILPSHDRVTAKRSESEANEQK